MKISILQRALSVLLIFLQLGVSFFSFNFFITESFATGNSGLNEAPDINSPNNYSVDIGQTTITTLAVSDEDNVVMEYGTTKLVGNTWSNIKHSEMCEAVVVSSARADVDREVQRVVRVKDKTANTFDIKVDNQATNIPSGDGTQVDWVVLNAGAQDLIDDNGVSWHIQANSIKTETNLGNSCRPNPSPTTSSDTFIPAFGALPSVIHSISSNNDTRSTASAVNANNGNRASEPTTTSIGTFLMRGFGVCNHETEIVDYLAMDQGHYVFGGVEIDSVRSTDSIAAVSATGYPITFSSAFSSVPQTILTSQLGEDGGNGGFGVVHTGSAPTTTRFAASVDEDGSTSRSHTTEPFGALAFETGSGVITQPNIFTYSIVGGADQTFFNLNQNGDLSFITAPNPVTDLDGDNIFELEVQVCDSHCNSKCSNQLIQVELNTAPTDIVLSHNSIDENEVIGSIIGTLSSSDVNTGDSHTHTLSCSTAGADDASFSITGNTLRSAELFDYETKNTYEICIKTDDGRGGIFEKIFNIGVNDLSDILLLINEVEYDTPGNENEAEWFEIYNPTNGTVNIQNWTITEEVGVGSSKTFTFPSLSIPAGGYIVVTNETADFQAVYPGNTPDLDLPGVQYFNLKNSPSDSLTLRDPSGTDIDYVAWENAGTGWNIEAIDRPICRFLVPDTDLVVDWSSDCIPTPQAVNEFNATPNDIMLSNDNFDENNTVNLHVGNFSTSDSDSSDTHVYSLVPGVGDTDNGAFSISGNMLIFTPVADYETQPSYTIRVQTDDGKTFGSYEEIFVITINDINLAPTDVILSNDVIDENNTLGDTLGILSGVDDGEDMNMLTYALSCTIPGTDDAAFNIVGTNLNAAAVYDYEAQDTYNICVRVSDGVLSYDKNFVIMIHDLDEVSPVVVINSITKLKNSSITDTTITVTDDVAINASDISIDALSSASASNLLCSQTSVTQVDCTISIDTSGDLLISALDTSGNMGSTTEVNYIVDPIPPQVPNVSVDTQGTFTVDNPELTFSSLDNIGVDYYTVTYFADDGGPGTGISTTINPATSPVILGLDPDETIHTIVVTAYDLAGNSSSTTIKFPPVITISAPTTISNTAITDSTFTVWTPTGNDLTNIVLAPGGSGATLGSCVGFGGDTTDPYANPVMCDINNISASGTITITAEDSVILAQGQNSQSYIIDSTPPQITITAPTLIDNMAIADTTISVIDDTAIDASDVVISPSSTVTYSAYSCVQTNPSRVDCTIQIDDDGDLTIDSTDLAGNLISDTESNYIIDTNPPVISLNGIDPETIEYLGAYTDADAIFTDTEDGTGTIIGAGSVNTGILGSYILTYDYTDTAGNPARQVTRTVNVIDTTPPVITLTGNTIETVEVNTVYIDAGATALDNFDGNLTPSILTVDAVDITTVGAYTVTYDITDSNGNIAAQVIRTVNVVDTTPPEIQLIGANEITIPVGGSYTENGATATDNYDSFAPGDIVIDSSTVDTTTLGTYYVTYNITDSNGNIATQVIREVIVTDTDIPVITLVGSDPVTVEVNTSYTDDGATANDNYDGDITANIVTANPVDITTVGTYTVTYDVIDSSGNVATQVTRTVNVVDTTPPVITLTGNAIETVEVNTVYIDAGATGIDNNDGDITTNITTLNGVDITTVGVYTVTYDVTDSNGNIASQVTRTVNVVDTTPPVITLTGNAIETVEVNTVYIDAGATGIDNNDGDITTNITTLNGVDITTVGVYTVTYDVTDSNGNIASQVTRTVNIVDTTPPVITLTGSTPLNIFKNAPYVEFGATCVDNYDATCAVTTGGITVDTSTIGVYVVTYDVSDVNGNVATQVARTVNVVPGDIPVITLTGSNPVTVEVNTSYTDAGATASDTEDGIVTSNISTVNPVNITTLGTYTLSYDVTDSSGNVASQVTRTVNVVDTTPPVITLTGNTSETVNLGDSYIDDGATCSDNFDLTCVISTVNPVDVNILGVYTITYDALDSNGNIASQVSRIVNVVSGNPPIISLIGDTNITQQVFENYTDSGATATDTEDGDITSNIVTLNSVDTTTVGTYTVSYDVIDSNLNAAIQVIRSVDIVDSTAPTITLNGSSQITIPFEGVYTELGAVCSDNYDIICTVNIGGDIVDSSVLDGVFVVRYDAIDANGNIAQTIQRTVNVSGGSSGQVIYDRCDGIDTSGNIYDGSCGDEIDEEMPLESENTQEITEDDNTIEILEQEIPLSVTTEEEIMIETPNDEKYNLENSFESCPIIDAINNPDYWYPQEGIFTDITNTYSNQSILKFAEIGIIDGYTDGTFQPTREMTRTEFLKVALISHCYEYQDQDTSTLVYIDVDTNSWQAKVISKAQSLGMINGDISDDGQVVFRPNDIITKAEAVKILMRLSFIQALQAEELTYTDINIDWHKPYIRTGQTLGLFDPEKDNGVFLPNDGVIRKDMIDLIEKLVQLYR